MGGGVNLVLWGAAFIGTFWGAGLERFGLMRKRVGILAISGGGGVDWYDEMGRADESRLGRWKIRHESADGM